MVDVDGVPIEGIKWCTNCRQLPADKGSLCRKCDEMIAGYAGTSVFSNSGTGQVSEVMIIAKEVEEDVKPEAPPGERAEKLSEEESKKEDLNKDAIREPKRSPDSVLPL